MILIMGLPNAGKTTYSQKYKNVIHLDELKGSNRHKQILKAIKENNNVCIEGIYLSANMRKELVAASNNTNICIFINTPKDVCVERNGRPKTLVEICARGLEIPTYDEGWDEIKIIKDEYN